MNICIAIIIAMHIFIKIILNISVSTVLFDDDLAMCDCLNDLNKHTTRKNVL